MFTLLPYFGSIFGLSCLLCLLLTPLAAWLASRWGLVDRPDARRKLHGRVIPVAGGIVVVLSTVVLLLVSPVFYNPVRVYKITDRVIASLRDGEVPEVVLDRLESLKGTEFQEGQLFAELRSVLPSDEFASYQAQVVRQAYTPLIPMSREVKAPGQASAVVVSELWPLLGLLFASVALCVLGVLDDLKGLRGRHKLLGQIAAAWVVVAFGVQIRSLTLFGWNCDLGLLSIPFTLFWLLAAINSLNLIDGMDGMLGCVGFIISLAMGIMAIMTGALIWACVAAALAGSLLGFLRYNLPPAKIFMGDAGSMVVGLVVGVLGIQSSLKVSASIALFAPLVILTIPFLDTLAALLRRLLTGRSIYATDRGHLHHCLLGKGWSIPAALGLVSLFSVLAAMGGLISLGMGRELIALCTLVSLTAILITTRLFGYAEFSLVKKRLDRVFSSLFQKRAVGKSHQIEVHLHGTVGWKDLKDAVAAHAFDLNLQTVRLDVSAPALHEEYHAQWDRFEEEVDDNLWRVELPITVGERKVGRMLVSGYVDSERMWNKVAKLIELIEAFQVVIARHPRFEAIATNGIVLPLPHKPILGQSVAIGLSDQLPNVATV